MSTPSSISANSSSDTDFSESAHLFWIYFCQGLFMMPANVLIFGAIAFHEPLRQRKEYIVIGGLALVDMVEGFGLFTAGLIRNIYIIERTAGKLVSRITCLLKPWNFAFMWTDPLSHIFLLTISIDRFITVKFPLKYYTFSVRYAYCLVGGTYLFMFINVLVGIIVTLSYTYAELPQICFTESAFEDTYYLYYSWLSVAADFSSIILYAIVIYLSVKLTKLSDLDRRIPALQKKAMNAQRKVTRTLGICSICTFLFNCLPLMGKILIQPYVGGAIDLLIPYTNVISNLNPISNFFIYTLRQRDLRIGVKNFLKCKRLTESALQMASSSTAPVMEVQSRQFRSINSVAVGSPTVRGTSVAAISS